MDNIWMSHIYEIRVLEGEEGENRVEKKYWMCNGLNFLKFKDSRSSANPKKTENKTLGISQSNFYKPNIIRKS